MWTLLVWVNDKVISGYQSLEKRYLEHKAKKKHGQQMMRSRQLPEYLRRDMGLPPYNTQSQEDKNT